MPKTLNIIGCGNLGKTLGRLWHANGTFVIGDVLNQSLTTAAKATEFIGAGRALDRYDDVSSADAYLIGTPDSAIRSACARLTDTGVLAPGQVVFHCSGALPATILECAGSKGAAVGGMHPIRSFADPEHAAANFSGTWCGIDGDTDAVALLEMACRSLGAQTVLVDPEFKSIYHAGAVIASNYLVTLLDVALQAYEKAGVPRPVACKLIEPLVRGTVENVFSIGTSRSLSGPIARGDTATVIRQYRALSNWDRGQGRLYKELGKMTAKLAARRRQNSDETG